MRSAQIKRHLGKAGSVLPRTALIATAVAQAAASKAGAPPLNLEFSPRDYITYLLSIDAEIEHCLMVQYLYAGYSLGGPQVEADYRDLVRGWQEVILGIAKEEMGHLMCVQNVLRVIGSPLHLEREDYPWDVPFYPFPFSLEPLTLDSLAKYVFAESPVNWDGGPLGAKIRQRVHAQAGDPHKVADLFNTLIPLLQDDTYLPDEAFQADTVTCQANWAEWGRGYHGGSRGNSSGAHPAQTPDVLVVPVTCRDEVVCALQAVAEQGEATTGAQASHFVRFLRIYYQMEIVFGDDEWPADTWALACPQGVASAEWMQYQPDTNLRHALTDWKPARNVAVNPYVSLDPEYTPEMGGATVTRISHPESALWATLHNVRYRMLLTYLQHSFTLYGGLNVAGLVTPRGSIVNATFGEMYNLRALSEILMQSPSGTLNDGSPNAGPPFQMPYTMNSPMGEANCWRAHLDLLGAAVGITTALLAIAPPQRHAYLHALREADQGMITIATRILSGEIDAALI